MIARTSFSRYVRAVDRVEKLLVKVIAALEANHIDYAIDTPEGFKLIDLTPLLIMKLQAYRFIDRAHMQDMINVGLIDARVRDALPPDLQKRLSETEAS